VAGKDR
jgi:hypothetical protein